jgi:DUF3054 family protein
VRAVTAGLVDLVAVAAFVVIGRSSHHEAGTVGGVLATGWPFLVGVVSGWLIARAWREPLAIVAAGVPVWVSTVVLGLLLRNLVAGDGTPASFVAVTTVVLAAFLLGWRAALRVVRRSPA